MPAYAVAHMHEVTMGPPIVEYLRRIDATLAPFGGRFIVHGGQAEVLEGNWPGHLIVIEFPGHGRAAAWYQPDAYQAIAALRTGHSRSDVILSTASAAATGPPTSSAQPISWPAFPRPGSYPSSRRMVSPISWFRPGANDSSVPTGGEACFLQHPQRAGAVAGRTGVQRPGRDQVQEQGQRLGGDAAAPGGPVDPVGDLGLAPGREAGRAAYELAVAGHRARPRSRPGPGSRYGGLAGRVIPAATVHDVGGRPAPATQVPRRFAAVADRNHSDRAVLGWHPERRAERTDPVCGHAEETRSQAGVHRSQQHEQRSETSVDVPVRSGPPRLGPVREALVRPGVTIQVGVLVRVRDDQQRRVHAGGEPVLGMRLGTDRVPEPADVSRVIQHQEAPALGEAGRGGPQSVAHDAIDYVRRNRPAGLVTAYHPAADNVLEFHASNVPLRSPTSIRGGRRAPWCRPGRDRHWPLRGAQPPPGTGWQAGQPGHHAWHPALSQHRQDGRIPAAAQPGDCVRPCANRVTSPVHSQRCVTTRSLRVHLGGRASFAGPHRQQPGNRAIACFGPCAEHHAVSEQRGRLLAGWAAHAGERYAEAVTPGPVGVTPRPQVWPENWAGAECLQQFTPAGPGSRPEPVVPGGARPRDPLRRVLLQDRPGSRANAAGPLEMRTARRRPARLFQGAGRASGINHPAGEFAVVKITDERRRCGQEGTEFDGYGAPDLPTVAEVEMVQKVSIALEDDLDGGPAVETVRFGLGGAEYEIDLSKKNARAFRKRLSTFVEHARKAGRAQSRRGTRTSASRQRSGDIRAWAKAQGMTLSERGRIPASIVQQYEAARGH